jgi:3',5'-cyclic AMP phosphodiesterase CpdA
MLPRDPTVFVLGDTAYPFATLENLNRCYGPTWGRYLAHTYAVPGNHDYVNGSAADFLTYFGARGGRTTWWRAQVGEWWVFGLDSNISGEDLAAQQHWLQGELVKIAGDGRCIAALWHHPLFSTGLHHGDGNRMRPVWAMLDAAGADLILNGHEHYYESFEPKNAQGDLVASGPREIIAGVGGAALADLSLGFEHRAYARVHGVVRLDLDAHSYRYAFVTLTGETRDAGEGVCRRASQKR